MLHPDLQEAVALYKALKAEADKGVVGRYIVKEITYTRVAPKEMPWKTGVTI